MTATTSPKGYAKADDHLRIRIPAELKAKAVEAAKAQGIGLSELVIRHLNNITQERGIK